ncbi:hypothetical protein [Adhaeribacter aquaticus]|uniref:hypothetical protein n=1 Tax=Adhaeribacter aquaticus TaxID=299567 RepID=UPI0003FC2007|nr:hypothetical protein [Adhaeribacter aquaticus]
MLYIQDYIELDKITKFQLLLEKGTALGSRSEGGYVKSLFQLGNFFVELWRSAKFAHVRHLLVTEDAAILDNYLEQININSLYGGELL